MKCKAFLIKTILLIYFTISQVNAIEIIRDTELEQYTDEIISILLKSENLDVDDINIFVDPKAIMYLLGTKMDYKEDKFASSFEPVLFVPQLTILICF